VPTGREPAGTLIVTLPLLSAVAAEVKLPLFRTTVPLGVGLPVPPFTATVTVNACAVVMLVADRVTVSTGVIFTCVTVTAEDMPVALL
jgi:hypothetical protein